MEVLSAHTRANDRHNRHFLLPRAWLTEAPTQRKVSQRKTRPEYGSTARFGRALVKRTTGFRMYVQISRTRPIRSSTMVELNFAYVDHNDADTGMSSDQLSVKGHVPTRSCNSVERGPLRCGRHNVPHAVRGFGRQ